MVLPHFSEAALLCFGLAAFAGCTALAGLDALEFGADNSGGSGLGTGGVAAGGSGGSATGGSAAAGSGTGGTAQGGAGAGGQPAPCGNGALDGDEGCDDSNTVAGDGCSADCQLEGDPDGCNGAPIDLTTTGIWIRDDTTGSGTSESASCGGEAGAEMLFELQAGAQGLATTSLEAGYPWVLATSDACWPGTTDKCQTGGGVASTSSYMYTGQKLYVYVGGQNGAQGVFTLHFILEP